MTFQLATDISKVNYTLEDLLEDNNYIMQPKYDGIRIIVEVWDGEIDGIYNRDEQITEKVKEKHLAHLRLLPYGRWLFDGEWVGKKYVIFDILEWPQGSVSSLRYSQRLDLLRELFEKMPWEDTNLIRVPVIAGAAKRTRLAALEEEKYEGAIFRHVDAAYQYSRSKFCIKYKFIKDIDCVVIDKNVDGKSNYELGLWDQDVLKSVGRVSALGGDKGAAKIGDVVKVQCLYAVSDRLVQPTKPRVRTDKKPEECTWDQLETIRTNKSV